MLLHPPSLKTWSAAPLSPDGETGMVSPARVAAGLVAATLATVAVLVLFVHAQLWWGLGLAAAALVLTACRLVLTRSYRLLGTHLLLRILLVLVVGLAYAIQQPDNRYAVWLAAAATLMGIVGEPLLDKLRSSRSMVAAHLPTLSDVREVRLSAHAAPLTSTAMTVAGGALAAADVPAWTWLVLALVALLVPVAVAGEGLLRMRAVARQRRGVVAAVAHYAPEFAIYAGRQEDASYQVMMWLPYLERTGKRFIVITRATGPARVLAGLVEVPIVSALTVAEIEPLLVPSLTTVFYPNAASANGQMVRFGHLAHVHLGHGDSDKATSSSPLHAMYDRVFSAGPAAIDRYAAHGVLIPRERFSIVGRPQVEQVQRTTRAIADVTAPTVLYAPTWRGHVDETHYYSIPRGEQIVSALLAHGATVIFRPHPFNLDIPEDAALVDRVDALLRADTTRTGRAHVFGEQATKVMSVIDCFNASDAMVSDVSSVITDYLHSGKPFAMYSLETSREEFVTEFPVARAAYLIAPDVANLERVCAELLGPDPLAAVREQVRTYYLGDFPEQDYAQVFVREAARVVDSGKRARDNEDDEGDNTEGDDAPDEETPDDGSSLLATEADEGTDTGLPVGLEDSDRARAGGALTRGEVLASLPTAAAVAAAALALSGAWLWLTALTAVVVLAAVSWSGQRRLDRPAVPALGTWLPVRVLLAVAAVAIAVRRGEDDRTLIWFTLGSLLLLAPLEMWVRTSRSVRRLRVRHLSTLTYANPRPWQQGWMFALGVAPLGAALVLGLVGASIWMAAALALEALVLAGWMVLREQRLIHASNRANEQLRGAIERYRPEFVVYFASKTGAEYQVGMWMPYFRRLGRRFIVVTRFDNALVPLAAMTDAPVILCRTLASLEATTVPSVRTVFYVNNGLTNTHYIEHRGMTHIWLNHGDSEKPACFNPVHNIYDRIFAAGQAGVDRYERHGVDIPLAKFEIVGRPQTSGIRRATAPISTVAAPTVLYAPTWVGPYADSRLYSLPGGQRIVEALLARGCTVIFRAHPLNYGYAEARGYITAIGRVLETDRAATGRQHLWGAAAEQLMDVKDCFNASDAMISDVSAVVTDYLQSQKPFSIVAAESNSEKLVTEAPVAVASYVLAGDLSNLDEVLDELLHADPLVEQRARTRDYYLGDFPPGDPAAPFLAAVRRHLDAPTAEQQPDVVAAR